MFTEICSFEDRFRYDDAGVPRVWKPRDDIESHYTSAREATIKLIPLFSEIKLTSTGSNPPLAEFVGPIPETTYLNSDDDVSTPFPSPDEFLILTEAKQVDLTTRFKRTADALYVEAKRSTISSVASIPIYFYALLLALGWNEIWAVLRNPLYFIFIIVLAVVAYVIYTLNLAGPMMRMGNAMMAQGVEIAREKLREFVDAPGAGAKAKAAVEEVGMVNLDRDRVGKAKVKTEGSDSDGW